MLTNLLPVVCLVALVIVLTLIVLSRRPLFATFCGIAAVGWSGLAIIMLTFSGWGDGASGSAAHKEDYIIFLLPSVGLFLFDVASARVIPPKVVRFVLVIAYAAMLLFSGICVRTDLRNILFALPFLICGFVAHKLLWTPKLKN